jgi:lysophospholipase L1-like esterase
VLAERPGSEVTNVAISGARVDDVIRLELPRLQGGTGLVLVEVGANDVVRHGAPAAFAASYARLLNGIVRRASGARLIVFGIPDLSISPLFAGRERAEIARLSRRDDQSVRAAAARYRAQFVDLYALSHAARAQSHRFLSGDDFHPSDAGHASIAAAAWPAVWRAITAQDRTAMTPRR